MNDIGRPGRLRKHGTIQADCWHRRSDGFVSSRGSGNIVERIASRKPLAGTDSPASQHAGACNDIRRRFERCHSRYRARPRCAGVRHRRIFAKGADGDVFFIGKRGVLTGWTGLKKRLDREILDVRREDGPKKSKPIAHWTLHDLRRTAATGMQSLEISDDVIDKVLNHVQPGVRKSYNHFARNPQKANALDAWSKYVAEIVSGEPKSDNVVDLRGK